MEDGEEPIVWVEEALKVEAPAGGPATFRSTPQPWFLRLELRETTPRDRFKSF